MSQEEIAATFADWIQLHALDLQDAAFAHGLASYREAKRSRARVKKELRLSPQNSQPRLDCNWQVGFWKPYYY